MFTSMGISDVYMIFIEALAVVDQWVRPQNLNRSRSRVRICQQRQYSAFGLGKAFYPHCPVPRKILKAIGPLVACFNIYKQLAFIVASFYKSFFYIIHVCLQTCWKFPSIALIQRENNVSWKQFTWFYHCEK